MRYSRLLEAAGFRSASTFGGAFGPMQLAENAFDLHHPLVGHYCTIVLAPEGVCRRQSQRIMVSDDDSV